MKENKIKCTTKTIINEIQKAKEIISNKNINDIWSGVLLEVKGRELIIKSTDRNIFFESKIKIENRGEDFKVLLNCQKLSEGLVIFDNFEEIEISFNPSENLIKISDIESQAEREQPSFPTEEIENFSYVVEEIKGEREIKVEQREFKKMIKKISFAASQEESKHVLNGVYFERDDSGKLTLIGTNGHRMSVFKTEIEIEDDLNFIIPVKMLNFLKGLLSEEGELTIEVSNNKFFTHFNEYKISCSLINGTYPEYKNIIPGEQKNVAIINGSDFSKKLSKVGSSTDKKSKKLFLNFYPSHLELFANDSSSLTKTKMKITDESFNYENGEETVIAINSDYLLECLNSIEGEKVVLSFNESSDVISFKEEESSKYLHLIMPMIVD